MTNLFHKRKTIDGVKKLKKISKSILLILEEAENQGIRWDKMPYTDLFKLTYRGKIKYFHAQIPSETTAFAQYCCKNKRVANNILSEAGLSVSKGYLVKYNDKKQFRLNLFKSMQKPLVVKPIDDSQGNNVFINISTQIEYTKAIEEIYTFNGQRKVDVLVEEMYEGDEYRILATQEKILSVIKRIPANVVGDGHSTIKQLIAVKNQNPIRIEMLTYCQIVVDDVVTDFLQGQNLTLESVVEKGKRVFLRPHNPPDMAFGGDTVDVTDQIHPSVSKIVSKLMESVPGLSLTGIDYMTKDIYSEQTSDNYRIIEINSSPSLDWNQYPLEGPGRRVAYEFLKIMFPELD